MIISCIFLGLAIGFIGGYAGISGAPLIISFLVLVLGLSQFIAQGTVLTMMLGPMTLLGILTMKEEVISQWKNILVGVLSYAIFSYLGAIIAFQIGEVDMKIYFSFMLILIAIISLIPTHKCKNEIKNIPLGWMILIGSIIGVIGGLFGIGAGVLMIPIFITIFHLKKNYARALSLAILLPPVSLGAFIKYNQEGSINWMIVFLLFFSYFISNYFGAKLGTKSSPIVFKRIYSGILIIMAVMYLL